MSSFRRAPKATLPSVPDAQLSSPADVPPTGVVVPGKQFMFSCGLRELDSILGGGLHYGSVTAILGFD